MTVESTSAKMAAGCAVALDVGDGLALPASLYGDADTARAAIVINSALGVPRSFYRAFASFLARQGYCVLCYDYEGNGVRDPTTLRRSRVDLSSWGRRDFVVAVRHMRAYVPGRPLCCVGHSVGGQLPGLADGQAEVDALVGVCAQSGEWWLWSGAARWRAWLQCHLAVPLLSAVLGYYPGHRYGLCTLPAGVAREWARWCRRRGYAAHPRSGFASGFAAFRRRALFISAYDDHMLAPRKAVDALSALYCNASADRLHVQAADVDGRAVGHFGFFNPATGKRLWPALAQWLQSNLPEISASWNDPQATRTHAARSSIL